MTTRRGTVFIAPATDHSPPPGRMVDPELGRFWVSWQCDPEGVIEDDEIGGAAAAIAWGRSRAPRVYIRLGREHETYFTAGDDPGFAPDDADAFPAWPPRAAPEGGWWRDSSS